MPRTPQNGRKSCGGVTPRRYQKILDLQQRQKLAEINDEQTSEEDETDSEDDDTDSMSNNHHVEMTNVVTQSEETLDKMPLIHHKDKRTIIAAVGLNDPARFQKLPIKMIPNASLETEKKPTEQASNCASTSGEQQYTEDNGSDNFTLHLSSHSEKTMPDDESSSRSLKENKVCSKENVRKRRYASPSSETKTVQKRSTRNEKNLCKKFVDELADKKILLRELSERINLENILEAYKENKTKEDIEREAVKVFGLEARKETLHKSPQKTPKETNPEIIPALIKCLEMFSALFVNDEFEETVLNAIKDRLKVTKVLEVLNEDEIKVAIIDKFTPTEILDLLWQKHRSTVSEEVLQKLSVGEITKHVESRNDLNTSESLLMVMLESFSQVVPEEANSSHENNVKSESDTLLLSTLGKVIKSRSYLKSSECLLNIMLRNGAENFTNETKQSIKNLILEKFSRQDFADLFNEMLIPKEKVNVID